MARPQHKSQTTPIEISLPAQTHAYLVKLATVGALGPSEQIIAANIVIAEVERLIATRRADLSP